MEWKKLAEAYQDEIRRLMEERKAAQEAARDKDHTHFMENQRLQQRNKVCDRP